MFSLAITSVIFILFFFGSTEGTICCLIIIDSCLVYYWYYFMSLVFAFGKSLVLTIYYWGSIITSQFS